MNIQIFGTGKCFDTKKAERWFKERRIKFQRIDLKKYGISRGELASVRAAVGRAQGADSKLLKPIGTARQGRVTAPRHTFTIILKDPTRFNCQFRRKMAADL